MTEPAAYPRLAPLKVGLRCRCPRCGRGALFKGFLTLAPACGVCGLDFSFADPADGPAFFSMTGVGLLIMGLFAWVEVAYRPPIWFHLAVTLPLLVIGCLAVLRPIKGWLVASQYYHKAEEGRFESYGKHGPF